MKEFVPESNFRATGQSPLFAAAERESIDVIRSLLGFRADVNQAKTDNVQDTP